MAQSLMPRPLKGFIEELLSFAPEFYRHILEYEEIQKTLAVYIEKLYDSFDEAAAESNIITASEKVIEWFEKTIGLKYAGRRELEDRRRLVLLYYNCIGHISATKIKQLVSYYTGAKYVDVSFNARDEKGNYILEIGCDRTSIRDDVFLEDIDLLFRKIIPAHLFYRIAFYYEHKIEIKLDSREDHLFTLEYCGTRPHTAMLADINGDITTQVETHKTNYGYDYLTAGPEITGTRPHTAMLYDDTNNINSEAKSDRINTVYELPFCGVFDSGNL